MAQKTKVQLKAFNDSNITTNNSNLITGAIHNEINEDLIDSFPNLTDNNTYLGLFPYESVRSYTVGQGVVYSNSIYVCVSATTGSWNSSHWRIDYVPSTGGNFTEAVSVNGNFSATTIYSGSTSLEDIIEIARTGDTIVTAGTNIDVDSAGSTPENYTVNLEDNIILDSVYATTISGTTLTATNSNFTSLTSTTSTFETSSATTISAGTIYSGSTDLSDIFLTDISTTDRNSLEVCPLYNLSGTTPILSTDYVRLTRCHNNAATYSVLQETPDSGIFSLVGDDSPDAFLIRKAWMDVQTPQFASAIDGGGDFDFICFEYLVGYYPDLQDIWDINGVTVTSVDGLSAYTFGWDGGESTTGNLTIHNGTCEHSIDINGVEKIGNIYDTTNYKTNKSDLFNSINSNNISATTISASTIYSGSTDLSDYFGNITSDINTLESEKYDKTGGTITGSVTVTNDLNVGIDKAIYIGDENTAESWRFIISGTSLLVQTRSGGVWTMKGEFTV